MAALCQCHHMPTQTRGESGFSAIFGEQQLLLPGSLAAPELPPGPSMAQLFSPGLSPSCYKCQELWAGQPGQQMHQ